MRTKSAALGLALSLALAACSSDATPSRPPTQAATSTPVAAASPEVVAASAVGVRSRSQVVALHAFGTGTTGTGTTGAGAVPRAELAGQGAAIERALRQQVRDATRLPPRAGTPAARLVGALTGYAGLAGELAHWRVGDPPLPTRWFSQLRTTDATWRAALRELSGPAGRDLLADLPTLVLPS